MRINFEVLVKNAKYVFERFSVDTVFRDGEYWAYVKDLDSWAIGNTEDEVVESIANHFSSNGKYEVRTTKGE